MVNYLNVHKIPTFSKLKLDHFISLLRQLQNPSNPVGRAISSAPRRLKDKPPYRVLLFLERLERKAREVASLLPEEEGAHQGDEHADDKPYAAQEERMELEAEYVAVQYLAAEAHEVVRRKAAYRRDALDARHEDAHEEESGKPGREHRYVLVEVVE